MGFTLQAQRKAPRTRAKAGRAFRALTAAAFGLGLGATAQAYEFSPIVAQFSPSGPGAAQSFLVRNTQPRPVAIEIQTMRRSMGPTGEDILEPEIEDFIVAPPQLVVAPGASQTIRVQWIGEPSPDHELYYRLIVSQLPIRYEREEEIERAAEIDLAFRYQAALYITPPGVSADVRVRAIDQAAGEDGARLLAVTLENQGDRRAVLRNAALALSGADGATIDLAGTALEGLSGRAVLARTSVTYTVPWPEGAPPGPWTGALSFGDGDG